MQGLFKSYMSNYQAFTTLSFKFLAFQDFYGKRMLILGPIMLPFYNIGVSLPYCTLVTLYGSKQLIISKIITLIFHISLLALFCALPYTCLQQVFQYFSNELGKCFVLSDALKEEVVYLKLWINQFPEEQSGFIGIASHSIFLYEKKRLSV